MNTQAGTVSLIRRVNRRNRSLKAAAPRIALPPFPSRESARGKTNQQQMVFDDGEGLSTQKQQYNHTAIINAVREQVDQWRKLPNPNNWQVTPETVRLLQHWRDPPVDAEITYRLPLLGLKLEGGGETDSISCRVQ